MKKNIFIMAICVAITSLIVSCGKIKTVSEFDFNGLKLGLDKNSSEQICTDLNGNEKLKNFESFKVNSFDVEVTNDSITEIVLNFDDTVKEENLLKKVEKQFGINSKDDFVKKITEISKTESKAIPENISGNIIYSKIEESGQCLVISKLDSLKIVVINNAFEFDNPSSDFKYTTTKDGTGVVITKYIGKNPIINIPAKIENLPVVEVAENFVERDCAGERYYNKYSGWITPWTNETIRAISFPDCVEEIQTDFEEFNKLEYMKLPANWREVTKDENKDTYRDKKTREILKVHKNRLTLRNTPALKTLIIPEGITCIDNFSNSGLETVILPSTVKMVYFNAFNGCEKLKEVIIPDSVEKITFDYLITDNYGYTASYSFSGGAFCGTNLNLETQNKLRKLGYTEQF